MTRRCWGILREREHSPGRETDDAEILGLTGKALESKGFDVKILDPDALVLDTLAVAYFSANRLDQAISTAQAALDLASTTGRDDLAADIRRRLESLKRERR